MKHLNYLPHCTCGRLQGDDYNSETMEMYTSNSWGLRGGMLWFYGYSLVHIGYSKRTKSKTLAFINCIFPQYKTS